jgi:phenylpyruvate tautomerase PptA (4-oxalocrotonate tautomerase family)
MFRRAGTRTDARDRFVENKSSSTGRSRNAAGYRIAIGQVVYQAMLDVLNVPNNDRFQVITEHAKTGMQFDRNYLGIQRSDDCIFLQITLNSGRTLEMKQRFYKAIADGLHDSLNVRREDVLINLVEVAKENWSFGNGEAQYAPPSA